MSRRNPTKAQRKIIFNYMQQGLSYEQAAMNLPESQPDDKCGPTHNDPNLTNTPKRLFTKKFKVEDLQTNK